MPKVYDQASRGTCAANAATALMEYYHGGKHRFSVQYLYERMKRAERDAYREAAVEIINDKIVSDPDIREYANYIRSDGESEADLAVRLYNKRIEMDGGSTAKYVFKVLEKYGICTYDIWPYSREQLDHLDLVTDVNNRYLPDGADDDAKRFRLNDKYYLFPSPNNVEEIKNYLCGLRYKPMPVFVGVRLFSGPDGKTLSEEGGIARLPKIVYVEIAKVCGEIDADAVKKTFSVISTDPDTAETVEKLSVLDSHSSGGHAMLLVGYVDDDSVVGGGYFIVRNSWGEEWGENGYGKLPYAYVELFATSAATILIPKDESDVPQPPPPPDPVEKLRPYLSVADRDMVDRFGKWRIGKGMRIIVDDNGVADVDTPLNRKAFEKLGYSWSGTGADGKPSEAGGKVTESVTHEAFALAGRYICALESKFGSAACGALEFPALGDVRKGGLFGIVRSMPKVDVFEKDRDLTDRFKAPLMVYCARGKKTCFRIAVVAVSDADHADAELLRAKEVLAEYIAARSFDRSSCMMTVVVSRHEIKDHIMPHIQQNDVQIVLDRHSSETGWRVGVASGIKDSALMEWLKVLTVKTPEQWRRLLISAWDVASAHGGHVKVSEIAEALDIPPEMAVSIMADPSLGFKVSGDVVEKL